MVQKDPTGHVAIIIDVQKDYIDIIEQNIEDKILENKYSRRLLLEDKVVIDSILDGFILGWIKMKE
jgi:hypothetical protein